MAANVDYGEIIKRSWNITWRNKWLWVYGLVLAAFGAGGSGGGGGGNSSSSSLKNNSTLKDFLKNPPPDLPEKGKQVLGAATTSISNWLSSVPVSTWVLLGLVIFLAIIIGMIIGIVIRNWATGALIKGLRNAADGVTPDLLNTSPHGLKYLKNLILLGLISGGLTLAFFISLALLGLLIFLLFKPSSVLAIIFGVLFSILIFLSFVVGLVILSMLSVYSQRLIVLHDYSPWQAWKKGLSLAKGNFFPTLIMSILNSAIGCSAGCLTSLVILAILALPAMIIIVPMFSNGFHFPAWPSIVALLLLFAVFSYTSMLLRAILVVFDTSNWNLFFEKIMQKEKQP